MKKSLALIILSMFLGAQTGFAMFNGDDKGDDQVDHKVDDKKIIMRAYNIDTKKETTVLFNINKENDDEEFEQQKDKNGGMYLLLHKDSLGKYFSNGLYKNDLNALKEFMLKKYHAGMRENITTLATHGEKYLKESDKEKKQIIANLVFKSFNELEYAQENLIEDIAYYCAMMCYLIRKSPMQDIKGHVMVINSGKKFLILDNNFKDPHFLEKN